MRVVLQSKVGQGYKFSSVGSRFKRQLQDLMDALHKMEPHYIRCIKPNSFNRRAPCLFNQCSALLHTSGKYQDAQCFLGLYNFSSLQQLIDRCQGPCRAGPWTLRTPTCYSSCGAEVCWRLCASPAQDSPPSSPSRTLWTTSGTWSPSCCHATTWMMLRWPGLPARKPSCRASRSATPRRAKDSTSFLLLDFVLLAL